MAFFVKNPITFPRIFSIGFWWNSIISVLLLDIIQNFTGSICFISQNGTIGNINARQQTDGNFGIMDISAR